jgi:hypothetical protein
VSPEEVIEKLAPLRPVWAFEDVPISLCLYPWVVPDGKGARIAYPGQRRDGKRWGMSAAYDPREEHYMLPSEVVRARPPAPQFAVTAAPVFDVILDPAVTRPVLMAHRSFKGALREGFRTASERPGLAEAIAVYTAASKRIEKPHRTYDERFLAMLGYVLESEALPVEFLTLRTRFGDLAGFQILWIGARELIQVFRFVVPQAVYATRLFDDAALRRAHGVEPTLSSRLNVGDAYRLRGLLHYKMALRPVELRPYFNVLRRDEDADYEQPA